jgi:hypothetical protein
MEYSETNEKKHAISPDPDSNGAPSEKRQKLVYRQCDCGLQFCKKGDIQATLDEFNCQELMGSSKFMHATIH